MLHARTRVVPALIAVGLGLWLASRIVPYQVDDAFITYRFAVQALHGAGLVYNAAGPAVEGFSSPAWLLASTSAGALLGEGAIPQASMALGLGCWLGLLVVVFRAGGAASVALLASAPTAIFYAVTGLETCAFALCVAAYAGALAGRAPRSLAFVAAAMASCVRPEGPFLPVAGLVQLACSEPAARRETARLWLSSSLVAGLAFAALLATRWSLFGEILPNTYYAKPGELGAGLAYVARSLSEPWALALLAAALLGACYGEASTRGYLAAASAWCAAAALEGGDWMPQARMLLPAWTLLALAAAGRVDSAAPRSRVALSWGAIALAVALGCAATLKQADTSQRSLASIRREARALTTRVGKSGAQSVAAIDIGELGFTLPIEILDLAGLTDARIAHSAGPHMNKLIDLGYVFDERKPDLIVVRMRDLELQPERGNVRLPPERAMSLIEARLLLDPRIRSDYQLALVQYPKHARSNTYARAVFRRKAFAPRPESRLDGPLLLVPTKS